MRYRVEWHPGLWEDAEKIQTRGNDEDYPTFLLHSADGTVRTISVHHSKVEVIHDDVGGRDLSLF